jgi:hypothetical protein
MKTLLVGLLLLIATRANANVTDLRCIVNPPSANASVVILVKTSLDPASAPMCYDRAAQCEVYVNYSPKPDPGEVACACTARERNGVMYAPVCMVESVESDASSRLICESTYPPGYYGNPTTTTTVP